MASHDTTKECKGLNSDGEENSVSHPAVATDASQYANASEISPLTMISQESCQRDLLALPLPEGPTQYPCLELEGQRSIWGDGLVERDTTPAPTIFPCWVYRSRDSEWLDGDETDRMQLGPVAQPMLTLRHQQNLGHDDDGASVAHGSHGNGREDMDASDTLTSVDEAPLLGAESSSDEVSARRGEADVRCETGPVLEAGPSGFVMEPGPVLDTGTGGVVMETGPVLEAGPGGVRRSLVWLALAAGLAITTTTLLCDPESNRSRQCHAYPPDKDRCEKVRACAEQISGQFYPPPSSATRRTLEGHPSLVDDKVRCAAMAWFLTGAGRKIAVNPEAGSDNSTPYGSVPAGDGGDGLRCSSWDSSFSILYSVLVLRESLQISDRSWHTDQSLEGVLGVCGWARIQCRNTADATDRPRHVIDGITLNNANLVGTIPPELMTLTHLRTLHLHTNPGLTGTIPTEIGLLKSSFDDDGAGGGLKSLLVQRSGLGGTVPTQMGELDTLRQFLFDNTMLAGSVPREVCHLVEAGSLFDLRGTCGQHDDDGRDHDGRGSDARGGVVPLSCPCCTGCKHPDGPRRRADGGFVFE